MNLLIIAAATEVNSSSINIGTLVTILGICVSIIAIISFFVGRKTAIRTEGKQEGETEGSIKTDIKYIKEGMARIEKSVCDTSSSLGGRMDNMSNQLITIATTAGRAMESSKMIHNRFNEHLRRDHGKEIVDWHEEDFKN